MGFLYYDDDLRDTIVKVRCQAILYRTTESVKRDARISNFKDVYELKKMPSNLCSRSYQINQVRDLKTAF